MSTILVIEAHSDDSAIGAYGYLNKRRKCGDRIFFAAMAMSDLHLNQCGFVTRQTRLDEYQNYVRQLDGQVVDDFQPFDAESRMDTVPRAQVVKACEKMVKSITPDILIVQGPSFHHDHTIVYEAAIAALRPTSRTQPSEILLMENPTYVHSLGPTTDFKPNSYCRLSEDEMTEKLACFNSCFPSQIRNRQNCLSPDGIKAWARYRALECMEEPYAEAFVTFRRKIS